MNPYQGVTFFDFFAVLFKRLFGVFLGQSYPMASDEIQCFVLTLVALSSAIIGTQLVLKKMTMLANSLAHTTLLGIVTVVLFMKWMGLVRWDLHNQSILLLGAFFSSCLTTLTTEGLRKTRVLHEDASIGIMFTAFFGLGVFLVTVFLRQSHLGIEAVMGNLDGLHASDLQPIITMFLINCCLFFLFFKQIFISIFDPIFAKQCGISVNALHYLIMLQTSFNATLAFRAVGVFLFLGFLVLPTLTAKYLTSSYKWIFILSGLFGIIVAFLSVALSRHFFSVSKIALSTGGIAITLLGGILLIILLFTSLKELWIKRKIIQTRANQ